MLTRCPPAPHGITKNEVYWVGYDPDLKRAVVGRGMLKHQLRNSRFETRLEVAEEFEYFWDTGVTPEWGGESED